MDAGNDSAGSETECKRKRNQTPLQYMLAVMNDPKAETFRRDRMAIASAPFVHPRVADVAKGKKDRQAEAAATAGVGTEWADDLKVATRAN